MVAGRAKIFPNLAGLKISSLLSTSNALSVSLAPSKSLKMLKHGHRCQVLAEYGRGQTSRFLPSHRRQQLSGSVHAGVEAASEQGSPDWEGVLFFDA